MVTPTPTPTLAPVVMFALIAVMMFRRIRRQFGRQPLNPRPITIRLVFLGIVATVLGVLAVMSPDLALPVVAGVCVGGLIAGINLRLTRFEWAPAGDAYYPHPYVGAVLSLLLAGRLVYRYYVLGGMPGVGSQAPATPWQSPLTFGLLALLIGYYIAYAVGLLVVRHRHHRGSV
jgi:hypothetical protein